MTTNPYSDFELPRLFALNDRLTAACFFLMKLLPARYIIEKALSTGALYPGGHVIESTSGTFGLALAMLSRVYDFELTLVSDPVIDPLLEAKLQDLGTHLDIVHSPGDHGYQRARIARVQELLSQNPGMYFVHQYNNPDNTTAYHAVADHLVKQLGTIDILVGSVGTGGSMVGTARRLRELCPSVTIVGVDTHNSVLFGHPDGKRILRGLGNSLMPGNVDHTQFDDIHWVNGPEAFLATRQLHQTTGLYQGGTSGASWLVAQYLSQQHPDKRIVTLFPDDGTRYQHTIYNDAWLEALPGWSTILPSAPQIVTSPTPVTPGWSTMHWNRQPYPVSAIAA